MESLKEPFYKITVPSLTHINWEQKLVESARIAISRNVLPVVYPVALDGSTLSSDELKSITKDQKTMNLVRQTRRVTDRVFETLPKPDKYSEVRVTLDVVDRLRDFHKAIDDKTRSGAIVAVILTELGWPVQRVTSILNTSRPTVNRWVFTHQDTEITEKEIQTFADAMRPEGSTWSALLDFRTVEFRLRRSAMVFKKAVFLPSPEVAQFMRALWRVAYRTRGSKSKYSEYVCAQTLDIMVELLLRRGVTAQNIGHILGIQHMAVIQRHRRSKDVYGAIEETMRNGDAALYAKDAARIETLKSYTAIKSYSSIEAAEAEPSLLLQVRIAQPTKHRPIPAPNLSVLCDKYNSDEASKFVEFDKLPADKAYKQLDAVPSRYQLSKPVLHRDTVVAAITEATAASAKYSDELFSSATLGVALFDGMMLGYPNINYPKDITDTRLTEYMLLQATMQYDRDKFGYGYEQTRYHWLPESVLELIDIVPDDSSKDVLKELSDEDAVIDIDTDRILDFFPVIHQNYIFTWMKYSDDEALEESSGKDPHGPLWKCLHEPSTILKAYPAPESRKSVA